MNGDTSPSHNKSSTYPAVNLGPERLKLYWPMKLVWPVTCFITFGLWVFFTPGEALALLVQSGGSIEEWNDHMSFPAGTFFPQPLAFLQGFCS